MKISMKFALKLLQTIGGLAICGIGVFFTLQASLGVSPWDVLHVGLAEHTGLKVGTAIIITSIAVLLLGLILGVRPGIGTICDILVVGTTVNILLDTGLLESADSFDIATRLTLFIAGTFITGLGIAIYVGAHLGAGPRDGLMVALHRRWAWPIWRARLAIELIGLTGGLLLSGPIGLGTVLWGALIGPSAAFWFKTLGLKPAFIPAGA